MGGDDFDKIEILEHRLEIITQRLYAAYGKYAIKNSGELCTVGEFARDLKHILTGKA